MSLVGDRMLALKTGQGRDKNTRNGPRGPAGLGIPFAVDRMQNLVEILGQPFAENADLAPKKQECRLNPSIFQSDSAWCAGLEIVENMHKGV